MQTVCCIKARGSKKAGTNNQQQKLLIDHWWARLSLGTALHGSRLFEDVSALFAISAAILAGLMLLATSVRHLERLHYHPSNPQRKSIRA